MKTEMNTTRQAGMMVIYGAILSIAGSLCFSVRVAGVTMLILAGVAFLLALSTAGKGAREDKQKAQQGPEGN